MCTRLGKAEISDVHTSLGPEKKCLMMFYRARVTLTGLNLSLV